MTKYWKRKVAKKKRSLYHKVDHDSFKMTHNYRPLAFQAYSLLLL